MQPGGAPCAPALSGAEPPHAALAIAGVKLDGVVPEQLALGGLRQVPAQHGLHTTWKVMSQISDALKYFSCEIKGL
jgi:hypothetical protein